MNDHVMSVKWVKVDEDKFQEAYKRWITTTNFDSGKTFTQFIGQKSWIHFEHPNPQVLMKPSAAEKIRMLLSSHYKTVIKAWKLKYEP